MRAVHVVQLIVNSAVSRGVAFKPLCTLWT